MQKLLVVAVLAFVVIVQSATFNSRIIDSSGKYEDYSLASKHGKLHKKYDPVSHRMRYLRYPSAKITTEPRMNVFDAPNKHVPGSVSFKVEEHRRHPEPQPKSKFWMLNGAHHGAKLKKRKAAKLARVVKQIAEKKAAKKAAKKAKAEKKAEKKPEKVSARTKKALREMKEDDGAPEQGFKGPIVEHDDGKTHTGDWRSEYGPKQKGEQDKEKLCKEHLEKYPDGEWCKNYLRSIRTPAPESGALSPTCAVSLLISTSLAVARFL